MSLDGRFHFTPIGANIGTVAAGLSDEELSAKGIVVRDSGYYCSICNVSLRQRDIPRHLDGQQHHQLSARADDIPSSMPSSSSVPAGIHEEISDAAMEIEGIFVEQGNPGPNQVMYCIRCNTFLRRSGVPDHMVGKKHRKNSRPRREAADP